ncbi:MAG TPA: HAD family phosphatase, partial [Polyangiaceae bacterium]
MSTIIELPPGDFGALIFDCDGTLADSMPLYHRAWRAALEANGASFDFTWDIFMSRAGVSTEGTVVELNQEFGTMLDPARIEELQYAEYTRLVDDVKPFPEVVAIAEAHYGKLPMAVASGGSRHLVERTLDLIGVRRLFDAVVVAADVPRGKPHPDIFLHAAKLLDVPPERCLVFEDGRPGIIAAEAAGMQSVFVKRDSPYVA